MPSPNHTCKAAELFSSLASRHGLNYEIEVESPIDLLWTFPKQAKLSLPLTLGLQNGDELNFGVSDFWSYFFPFGDVTEHFESIVDAWIEGSARVAVVGWGGRILQVRDGEGWETVYRANVWPFQFMQRPRSFIMNEQGRVCEDGA